jgi:hypothetical protein
MGKRACGNICFQGELMQKAGEASFIKGMIEGTRSQETIQ